MRYLSALAAVAAILVLLPGEASAQLRKSVNGVTVEFSSPGSMELFVEARSGFGPRDVFCAAGDVASRFMNASGNDRVRLVAVPERRGQRQYAFRLLRGASRADDRGGFLLNIRKPGETRSVALSRALCEPLKRFRQDDD